MSKYQYEPTPVLGHICPELAAFQTDVNRYGCWPRIDADGIIAGCDADAEDYPIKFCPWCGETLETN